MQNLGPHSGLPSQNLQVNPVRGQVVEAVVSGHRALKARSSHSTKHTWLPVACAWNRTGRDSCGADVGLSSHKLGHLWGVGGALLLPWLLSTETGPTQHT